jgi:tryptophan-rich sensory protein
MSSVASFIACVLGCIAVGGLSASLSPRGPWYEALAKPVWMPPGWLFGPVWTFLYALMGAALFLVLQKGWTAGGVKWAVTLFAVQLALNFAWSPVFFRFQSLGGSVALIIVLWLMIGWTVAAFWSVRDWAGALLLPYWAWVTFATALNTTLWRMNA